MEIYFSHKNLVLSGLFLLFRLFSSSLIVYSAVMALWLYSAIVMICFVVIWHVSFARSLCVCVLCIGMQFVCGIMAKLNLVISIPFHFIVSLSMLTTSSFANRFRLEQSNEERKHAAREEKGCALTCSKQFHVHFIVEPSLLFNKLQFQTKQHGFAR